MRIRFTHPTTSWTSGQAQAYTTGPDPMVDLGGVYGLIAGDGNADDAVNVSDFFTMRTGGPRADVYEPGDYNLDGFVNVSDFFLWLAASPAIAQWPAR